MHRASFTPRIGKVRGKLCIIVNAQTRYNSFDCFRVYENGKCECRNLCFCRLSGYLVDYNGKDGSLDKWCESLVEGKGLYETAYTLVDEEKALLIKHYPEFKYILAKAPHLKKYEAFKVLNLWKEHPQIENILALGFVRLALTPSIYNLSKAGIRMVLDYIKAHPEDKNVFLTKIRTCHKEHLTPDEFDTFWDFKSLNKGCSFEDYRYLSKQDNSISTARVYFKDYKPACIELGKDWKDHYWRYPSNFWKQHKKVMEQLEAKHEVERLAREEQEAARKRRMAKLYMKDHEELRKAAAKFAGKTLTIGEYEVHVPANFTEIKKQAEALHQCLVACRYDKRMIEGTCILLFVSKNGKPSSTAEIVTNGQVAQFYADEHAVNMMPTDKERKLVDAFIDKFYYSTMAKSKAKKNAKKQRMAA